MRFLADENIPGDAVAALRAAGHDVVWVRTEAPGIIDQEVLALSAAESRVLLTFDKDFGELAWNARLRPSCGIVLFRLAAMGATEVCNGIATILNGRDDWVGHFSAQPLPGHTSARMQARGDCDQGCPESANSDPASELPSEARAR